jgi:UDP-N-acetylglucosamine 2-epimerase (non-hydrolysing)
VIGTRPEAIKLAPLAHALEARGLAPTLVFTGQHPDLDPADFALSKFPRVELRCPGRRDSHEQVRHVTAALLPLLRDPPDLLVVQGDTSSALGAALAGFAAAIPVAHVEAGLRTHDPRLPWPEEEYRTAIDARADLLFAPTRIAAANLRAEQAPGEVHITGNTSIDAVLAVEAKLPTLAPRQGGLQRVLVTCHRRESWGEGLESVAAALIAIARDATIDLILHPNPHVAKVMRSRLATTRNVALFDPCSHWELVRRMRDADLILSDSGGIQEEAPALGTPLLVLREKTERPEGIATGNMRLVGTSTRAISTEARRLLQDPVALAAMSRRSFPYGDGQAAPRIATIIEEWLRASSIGGRLARAGDGAKL